MRIKNDSIVVAQSMGADVASDIVFLGHIYGFAIQALWSAGSTPTGTLKVQGSCDNGVSDSDPTGVTNWEDIATQAVSGNTGAKLFNLDGQHYKWVRLAYTRSGGSATLNARINLKGI
jgi:hypothetical protein